MNLTKIVQTASALASLLPAAATLVQAVEAAMPAGTSGATKLEAVRVGINAVYSAGEQIAVEFAAVWGPLSAMISTLVTAYHAAGIFATKTTPAAQ